jgi:hypothetical protein
LDVSNGFGQEAILKLETLIESGGRWLTDTNGMQMMMRQRRYNTSDDLVLEPEAMNYYPATTAAALPSTNVSAMGLSLVFGASHGVASLTDGNPVTLPNPHVLWHTNSQCA